MNVFEETEEVRFLIAEYGFVPALEEMPDGAVFPIIVHGVGLVETLHDFGKRDIPGFDEQMNVIVHEDVCINTATGAVFIDREEQKILLKVRGVSKYPLTLISADYDVIKGAFVFDAWFAWHGFNVAKLRREVNISCFKSDPIWSPYDSPGTIGHLLRGT